MYMTFTVVSHTDFTRVVTFNSRVRVKCYKFSNSLQHQGITVPGMCRHNSHVKTERKLK